MVVKEAVVFCSCRVGGGGLLLKEVRLRGPRLFLVGSGCHSGNDTLLFVVCT